MKFIIAMSIFGATMARSQPLTNFLGLVKPAAGWAQCAAVIGGHQEVSVAADCAEDVLALWRDGQESAAFVGTGGTTCELMELIDDGRGEWRIRTYCAFSQFVERWQIWDGPSQ